MDFILCRGNIGETCHLSSCHLLSPLSQFEVILLSHLNDTSLKLRKVEAGSVSRQWLESLVQSNICKVTFIFVPGHAGVGGNERADSLADSAIVSDGRPMDRADIINSLKDSSRKEDIHEHESTAVPRMVELRVRRGAASRTPYGSH